MKLKSILLVSAAVGLLSPSILSTVSSNQPTVQAETTDKKTDKTLNSVVPPVLSNYWHEWRHVVLTQPLTATNNWKTTSLAAGTSVYMIGYTKTFTIKTQQPDQKNNQTTLKAKIEGTPNVKLIDDNSNSIVSKLEFKQASVKRFNTKKFHAGYYDGDVSDAKDEPVLLFTSLKNAKKYTKLADKMGEISDDTDGDTKVLSKKEKASIRRTTKQYKTAKKNVKHFTDPTKKVSVKLLRGGYYQWVKLDGKKYYTSGGVNSGLSPYNVQNGAGTIQSPLDPTSKKSSFVAPKGSTLYLYKGEKWIGPHKWQYDGNKWIQNNNLKW